jgi:hypothetical protein
VNDFAAFARLIRAIEPWREQLVLAGGWAHRLHRFHPIAKAISYRPIATKDADLVFGAGVRLEGSIRDALTRADFKEEFSGEHRPPVAHYTMRDGGAGFYAEFLTPLRGSGTRRTGEPDATVAKAGVTAQKLRHLELLLIEPWPIRIDADQGVTATTPMDVLVANPVAFIVQKLLIQKYRSAAKKAQDALYIHDTIELFGGALPTLNDLWSRSLAPALGPRTTKRVAEVTQETFSSVTEAVREAARIPQDRALTPERLQTLCQVGLKRILG